MRYFELHFRHRHGKDLDDHFRIVEAKSKAAATRDGKELATKSTSEGDLWMLFGVREVANALGHDLVKVEGG